MAKTNAVSVEVPQDNNGADDQEPLHVSVVTRVANSDTIIDTRICDMYDPGVRKWIGNHQFWALSHGHVVSIIPASTDEVGAYTAKQAILLRRRYSK